MVNMIFIDGIATEIEHKASRSGKEYAAFRLEYNAGRGQYAKRESIAVVAFGRNCDAVMALGNGAHIIVSGEFSIGEWTGKDGGRRIAPRIEASSVEPVIHMGAQVAAGNHAADASEDVEAPF